MRDPKILVLGGAGFVGSNFIRHCLSRRYEKITVFDSLDPHFQSTCVSLEEVWNKITFIRGDLRDEKALADVVRDHDVIYNFAGQSSHTLSLKHPLLDAEINCLSHLKLLEAVRLFNKDALVIYASSSTVVGEAREAIVDENHPERPLEIYSANKGVAEKYYRIYHRVHGLKTLVLRFANLYGPYGKSDANFGFINYFIARSWEDKSISIFGNGEQTRNVMYIQDACDILHKSSRAPALVGEIFFATSPFHHSVQEIASEIVEVFGRGNIEYVDWPHERKIMDVHDARFSSEKLRAVTGWFAKTTFLEGLEKTAKIMKNLDEQPFEFLRTPGSKS